MRQAIHSQASRGNDEGEGPRRRPVRDEKTVLDFLSLNLFEFENARSYVINLLGRSGEFSMLDAATTALLRAVLEEVCKSVAQSNSGVRAHVASKLLEAANRGERTHQLLKQIGLDALRQAPSMWR